MYSNKLCWVHLQIDLHQKQRFISFADYKQRSFLRHPILCSFVVLLWMIFFLKMCFDNLLRLIQKGVKKLPSSQIYFLSVVIPLWLHSISSNIVSNCCLVGSLTTMIITFFNTQVPKVRWWLPEPCLFTCASGWVHHVSAVADCILWVQPAHPWLLEGWDRPLCELSNPNVSELLGLGQGVPIKMSRASRCLHLIQITSVQNELPSPSFLQGPLWS